MIKRKVSLPHQDINCPVGSFRQRTRFPDGVPGGRRRLAQRPVGHGQVGHGREARQRQVRRQRVAHGRSQQEGIRGKILIHHIFPISHMDTLH